MLDYIMLYNNILSGINFNYFLGGKITKYDRIITVKYHSLMSLIKKKNFLILKSFLCDMYFSYKLLRHRIFSLVNNLCFRF